MKYSLLLADIDNTLFDFRSAERAAYAAVAARFSFPDDEETFLVYKAVNTFHWRKLRRGETTSAMLRLDRFRDFFATLGIEDTDGQAVSDLYVETLGMQATPVDGAEDFLRKLSAQMPVMLVTNGFARVQRARMRFSPLRHYIRDMLISEEFARGKPDPQMLWEAMRRARIADPAQAVMIGDNEDTDILAAKNAGMPAILFTNGAPPPAATRADFTAATLKEAGDWILSD